MDKQRLIIGAIAGDIIGSVYEFDNVKNIKFDLFCDETTFTDDSVLTIATMDAILNTKNYGLSYLSLGRNYPDRGYGGNFHSWLFSNNPEPYYSWG
jgi:ADP-ribosylglycohydrolase